jgi:lipopolysaccharide transport protein LptA
MIRLDRTSIRMMGGIAFILVFAAVLIVIYVAVRPSEAEVQRAAAALQNESKPSEARDPYAWPDVVRWSFVTELPVAEKVNAYRWRAQGGLACSLDRDRDRLVNFRLDTPNAKDPIELSAPVALFDKAARILTSNAGAQVIFTWGTVTSTDLRIELDTVDAFFDNNVVVVVTERGNIGLAPGGAATTDDSTGANETAGGDDAGAADGDTTNEPKKEPLTITADHFEIRSAEDKGIFTGNVIAKDGTGTICADKMIVEYYTKQEKQADPTLTGMKLITCIGHVRIDQQTGPTIDPETGQQTGKKTEQAFCEQAVYDVAKNIMTMEKSETAQVRYRKVSDEEHYEIEADSVVIDRNPGGKTLFSGHTKTVDFSPTREAFFGLMEKDQETQTDDGAGPTDEQ